ncbi:MAG: CAP domain-containing protein [Chloroflexota bacterium]
MAEAREFNSPSAVIAQINAYRSENGLYSYQPNSILMTTAQDQSNYMASTGSISHVGAGGTSPKDRGYAAGYGDGQIIFMSEIIYGGNNATIDDAMAFWKSSSNHNPWVLSSNYVDIGAGVATDGTSVYYTTVMAYVAGGVAPTPGIDDGGNTGGEVITVPVLISPPNADRSVIHTVQSGQTLVGIATAYSVPLSQLFELNGLNENSYIFPEDEIIIITALALGTSTPTATIEAPTATPTPTFTPASTAATTSALSAAAGASTGETKASVETVGENSPFRSWVFVGIVSIFLVLTIGLFIPKARVETE